MCGRGETKEVRQRLPEDAVVQHTAPSPVCLPLWLCLRCSLFGSPQYHHHSSPASQHGPNALAGDNPHNPHSPPPLPPHFPFHLLPRRLLWKQCGHGGVCVRGGWVGRCCPLLIGLRRLFPFGINHGAIKASMYIYCHGDSTLLGML